MEKGLYILLYWEKYTHLKQQAMSSFLREDRNNVIVATCKTSPLYQALSYGVSKSKSFEKLLMVMWLMWKRLPQLYTAYLMKMYTHIKLKSYKSEPQPKMLTEPIGKISYLALHESHILWIYCGFIVKQCFESTTNANAS